MLVNRRKGKADYSIHIFRIGIQDVTSHKLHPHAHLHTSLIRICLCFQGQRRILKIFIDFLSSVDFSGQNHGHFFGFLIDKAQFFHGLNLSVKVFGLVF